MIRNHWRWTAKEDDLLSGLVNKYQVNKKISWIDIQSHFKNRSKSALQKRWKTTLSHKQFLPSWTGDEEQNLMRLIIALLENNYEQYAEYFPNHSLDQIIKKINNIQFCKAQSEIDISNNDLKWEQIHVHPKPKAYSSQKRRRELLLLNEESEISPNRDYSELSAKLQNSSNSLLSYYWNDQKSWMNQPNNLPKLQEKNSKVKSKMSLNKFLYKNGLFNSKEKRWSMLETQKLFKLYHEYGDDWRSISRQLDNSRSINSTKWHFFNVLRWAADEYKYDSDRQLKKFEVFKFETPHSKLYQKSFFSSSQTQLIWLIEVAFVLLSLWKTSRRSSKTSGKAKNRAIIYSTPNKKTTGTLWGKRSRIDQFYPSSNAKHQKCSENEQSDWEIKNKQNCSFSESSIPSISMLKSSKTWRKVKKFKIKLYSDEDSETVIVPFDE